MALFVLRKLILQTRMRNHPVGLDVGFLVGLFVYCHTLCVRTAKALVRLCICAGSPEPSLVAYVISTIIPQAGLNVTFILRSLARPKLKYVWAASWQNQQNDCASSEDSDQPVHPVWSESSLCAQMGAKDPSLLHADRLSGCPGWSESSLGAHAILLVLSRGGSYILFGPL